MTTHPANQPPVVSAAERERRERAWEAQLDAEDLRLRDQAERRMRARAEMSDDERRELGREAARVFGGRR